MIYYPNSPGYKEKIAEMKRNKELIRKIKKEENKKMNMKLYTIKDTIVGAMTTPFAGVNDGSAIRSVKNMINSPADNEVKANYKDKQLYCVGSYNDETGEIVPQVRFITNLSELKEEV